MKTQITSKLDLKGVVDTLHKSFLGFTTALSNPNLPTQENIKALQGNNGELASTQSQLDFGSNSLSQPYDKFQTSFHNLVAKVKSNKKNNINLRDDLIKKTFTLISNFKVALQSLKTSNDLTRDYIDQQIARLDEFSKLDISDSKTIFPDWKPAVPVTNNSNKKDTSSTSKQPEATAPKPNLILTNTGKRFFNAIENINTGLGDILVELVTNKTPSDNAFTNIKTNIDIIIQAEHTKKDSLKLDSTKLDQISKELEKIAQAFKKSPLEIEVVKLQLESFLTQMTALESLLAGYFKIQPDQHTPALTTIGLLPPVSKEFEFNLSPSAMHISLLNELNNRIQNIFPQIKDGKSEEKDVKEDPLKDAILTWKKEAEKAKQKTASLEPLFDALNKVTTIKTKRGVDNELYSAEKIYTLLEYAIGSKGGNLAEIVKPNNSSITSPFNANKENAHLGSINYAEKLAELKQKSPHMPIVMIINTDKGQVLLLRIPPNYEPQPYVKNTAPIKDKDKERIILIDPLGEHEKLPPEFEEILYNGVTYKVDDKISKTIPPVFSKDKTSFISNYEIVQQFVDDDTKDDNRVDRGPLCIRAAIGLVINGGDIEFIKAFNNREPALVTRILLSGIIIPEQAAQKTASELNLTEEQERDVFFHLSVVLRELTNHANAVASDEELQIVKNKFAEKYRVFHNLYKNLAPGLRTSSIRNAYDESVELKKQIDKITQPNKSSSKQEDFPSFRSGSLRLHIYQEKNKSLQNSNSNKSAPDNTSAEIVNNLKSASNKFNADWDRFSNDKLFSAISLLSDLKKLTTQILGTSTTHLFSTFNHIADAINVLNIPGLTISNKINSKEGALIQLNIISAFIKNNKEIASFIKSCVRLALDIRHHAIDLEILCDTWHKTFPNSKEISSDLFLHPTTEWINATKQLTNLITTLNEFAITNDFKDAKNQILTVRSNLNFIQKDIYELNLPSISDNKNFFSAVIIEIQKQWDILYSSKSTANIFQLVKILHDSQQLIDNYSYWFDFINTYENYYQQQIPGNVQQPLSLQTNDFIPDLISPSNNTANTISKIQKQSTLHQAKILEAFLTEIISQTKEFQKDLQIAISNFNQATQHGSKENKKSEIASLELQLRAIISDIDKTSDLTQLEKDYAKHLETLDKLMQRQHPATPVDDKNRSVNGNVSQTNSMELPDNTNDIAQIKDDKLDISPQQSGSNTIPIISSVSSENVYFTALRPYQPKAIDQVTTEAALKELAEKVAKGELYNLLDANIRKVDELRQLNKLVWDKTTKIMLVLGNVFSIFLLAGRAVYRYAKKSEAINNIVNLSELWVSRPNQRDLNQLTQGNFVYLVANNKIKLSYFYNKLTDDQQIAFIQKLTQIISSKISTNDKGEETVGIEMLKTLITEASPRISAPVISSCIENLFPQTKNVPRAATDYDKARQIYTEVIEAAIPQANSISPTQKQALANIWDQLLNATNIKHSLDPMLVTQLFLDSWFKIIELSNIQILKEIFYATQTATQQKIIDSFSTSNPSGIEAPYLDLFYQKIKEARLQAFEFIQTAAEDKYRDSLIATIDSSLISEVITIAYKNEQSEELARQVNNAKKLFPTDGIHAPGVHESAQNKFRLTMIQEILRQGINFREDGALDYQKNEKFLLTFLRNLNKENRDLLANNLNNPDNQNYLFKQLIPDNEKAKEQIANLIDEAFIVYSDYTKAFLFEKHIQSHIFRLEGDLKEFINARLTLEHPVVIADFLFHVLNISYTQRKNERLDAAQWEELKAEFCATSLHITSTSLAKANLEKPADEIKRQSLERSKFTIIQSLCALPTQLGKLIYLLSTLKPGSRYTCKNLLDDITWAIEYAKNAIPALPTTDLEAALANALEKLSTSKHLPSMLEKIFKQESFVSPPAEIKSSTKDEIVPDNDLEVRHFTKNETDHNGHLKVRSITSRLITSGASEVVCNTILQNFDKFAYQWNDVNLVYIYRDVLVCNNKSAQQNFINAFKKHSPFGVLTVFTKDFKPSANVVQDAFTQLRDRYRPHDQSAQLNEPHTRQVLANMFSQLRDANQNIEVQTFIRLMSSHSHSTSRRSIENREIIFDAFLAQMETYGENPISFQEYFTDTASTNPKKPTDTQKVYNQALLEMTKYLVDLDDAARKNISPLDQSPEKKDEPIALTLKESQKRAIEKTNRIFERVYRLNNSNFDSVVDLLKRMEKMSPGSAGKFLYQIIMQAQEAPSGSNSYQFEQQLLKYIFQNGERNKNCAKLEMILLATIKKETATDKLSLALLTLFEQIKSLNESDMSNSKVEASKPIIANELKEEISPVNSNEIKKEEISSAELTEKIITNLQSKVAQQNTSSSVSGLYGMYLSAHETFSATPTRKSTSYSTYGNKESNKKFDRWTKLLSASDKVNKLSSYEQYEYIKMYLQKFSSQTTYARHFKPGPTSEQMLAGTNCLLALYRSDRGLFESFLQNLLKIRPVDYADYKNSLENLCRQQEKLSDQDNTALPLIANLIPKVPERVISMVDIDEPGVPTAPFTNMKVS